MLTPNEPRPPVTQTDPVSTRPPAVKIEAKVATEDSLSRLTAFVSDVMKRYDQVSKLFDGKPVLPTKNPEFKKFVDDTLSEVSMRYVIFGSFSRPGESSEEPANVEERLKQQGFSVSKDKLKGLDPTLAESPAALLALAEGANLVDDE